MTITGYCQTLETAEPETLNIMIKVQFGVSLIQVFTILQGRFELLWGLELQLLQKLIYFYRWLSSYSLANGKGTLLIALLFTIWF